MNCYVMSSLHYVQGMLLNLHTGNRNEVLQKESLSSIDLTCLHEVGLTENIIKMDIYI